MRGDPDPFGGAWRLVHRTRAVAVACLAIACLVIDDLGTGRHLAAGGLAILLVCYLGAEVFVRRGGRVPDILVLAEPAIALPFVFVLDAAWLPALTIMVAGIALVATTRTLRTVLVLLGVLIVAVAAAGATTQDGTDASVGTVAFATAGLLAAYPVSVLADRQRRLATQHESLVSNLAAIVWELPEGADEYSFLGARASELLGFQLDRLVDLGHWIEQVHPDDRANVVDGRAASLHFRKSSSLEYRMIDSVGDVVWLREVLSVDETTDQPLLRGVAFDVTEQRTAEMGRALYTEVVGSIATAIIVAKLVADDAPLEVVAANPAAAQLLGSKPIGLVGRPLSDRMTSFDPSTLDRIRAVANGAEPFAIDRAEGVGIDRGKIFSVEVFGLPENAVGIAFDDVTGAAMVAAALRRQALHDGLTGLPNRTLLRDRLAMALTEARRRKERVALILMDLNHFKDVNDALGHQYGDQLLVAFAKRLQVLLRECDTIARLGGDEFALLLTNATNEGASNVVRKVTEAMQEPFDLDGVTIQATSSLGVALFPDHGEDADLLTQRADVAMYTAKRGGGGWAIYSPAHDQSSIERLTLLSDLHREFESPASRTMSLAYQPILDLATDTIVGAEALLRWNHPIYGNLNPEVVVDLAELSGLIQSLARMVAGDAMKTARLWAGRGVDLRVAINLSARNLYDRQLVNWLRDTLEAAEMPPSALKCELTESQVMDDPVLAMEVLTALRSHGISTAIDDFGTGYSSLAYLNRLPVDEIKIDKSFVMTMRTDPSNETIVKTVIDLAHNLGMGVLAEGVEDLATLEMLRSFGCDRVQGFLIGRPVPATEFWDRLPRMTDVLDHTH